jgi:segregation and condensation protein B
MIVAGRRGPRHRRDPGEPARGDSKVTSDDPERSLADEAASWVPPWERAKPAEPSASADGAEPVDDADVAAAFEGVDTAAALEDADVDEAEEEMAAAEADDAAAIDEADEPYADTLADEAAEPLVGGPDVPPEEYASFDGALADAVLPEAAPQSSGPLALIGDAELRGALEAILLVVEEPVNDVTLAQVLEQPTERITELLGGLADEYESTGRGFELRRAAGGWRFYTRPEYAQYVERFVLDGQQLRLTQAALETLAVVAYKQPVTRSRISAIRGVNCDGVIRTLVSRGLVEESGAEPDSGAFLYRTTTLFLEKLGLNSVEDLPPLAPFLPDDVDEIADAPR